MIKSTFQFTNPRIIKSIFVANEEIPPYDREQYAVEMEGKTEVKKKQNDNIVLVGFTVIVNKDEEYMKAHKLPFYSYVTAMAEFVCDGDIA